MNYIVITRDGTPKVVHGGEGTMLEKYAKIAQHIFVVVDDDLIDRWDGDHWAEIEHDYLVDA